MASKVEKLLIEVEQQLSGDLRASDGTLESRTRLLERVASEVSRLNFYCNKGKVTMPSALSQWASGDLCPCIECPHRICRACL